MRSALIVIVLLGVACSDGGAPPAPEPLAGTVSVERVIDGDSVRLRDEIGDLEVRLIGVNAPERDECHAERSRAALEDLLAEAAVALTPVDTDQFGRELAYVAAGGRDVNLALVATGAALATGGDHPRRAAYLAAEEEAFAMQAGLWAPGACGPATGGLRIAAVAADPDGPDDQDLLGEWTDVANDRDDDVDLTGWVLRDDSSTHRYRFPDGFLLAPGAQVRVVVGCGRDDAVTLHWCSNSPVWSNAGDAALLLDPSGNVAARLRY